MTEVRGTVQGGELTRVRREDGSPIAKEQTSDRGGAGHR